jgi:transposase-like protein
MGSYHIHCYHDRLLGSNAAAVGKEGRGEQRQACRRAGKVADRLKALERENRELRQAKEILRKASAYFAEAEFDRPFKR